MMKIGHQNEHLAGVENNLRMPCSDARGRCVTGNVGALLSPSMQGLYRLLIVFELKADIKDPINMK